MQKVKVNVLNNQCVISEVRNGKIVKKVSDAKFIEEVEEVQHDLFYPFELDNVNANEEIKEKVYSMSRRHKSRVKTIVNYCLNEYSNQVWKFYTITTCQSENGMSDKQVVKAFSQVLENWKRTYGLKFYMWVAERQQNGSLHFHIFANGDKVDFSENSDIIAYLNRKFPMTNSNVINGKRVYSKSVSKYLTKYITKNEVSLTIRPSQISHQLSADYEINRDKYEVQIVCDEINPDFETILQYCDKCVFTFNNEYNSVYVLHTFDIQRLFQFVQENKKLNLKE